MVWCYLRNRFGIATELGFPGYELASYLIKRKKDDDKDKKDVEPGHPGAEGDP